MNWLIPITAILLGGLFIALGAWKVWQATRPATPADIERFMEDV